LRAKAAALVNPIKVRIVEALRGDGDGWSSRMLRLIQRFRKSVHERGRAIFQLILRDGAATPRVSNHRPLDARS